MAGIEPWRAVSRHKIGRVERCSVRKSGFALFSEWFPGARLMLPLRSTMASLLRPPARRCRNSQPITVIVLPWDASQEFAAWFALPVRLPR